jgi:hypothetical protein
MLSVTSRPELLRPQASAAGTARDEGQQHTGSSMPHCSLLASSAFFLAKFSCTRHHHSQSALSAQAPKRHKLRLGSSSSSSPWTAHRLVRRRRDLLRGTHSLTGIHPHTHERQPQPPARAHLSGDGLGGLCLGGLLLLHRRPHVSCEATRCAHRTVCALVLPRRQGPPSAQSAADSRQSSEHAQSAATRGPMQGRRREISPRC